MKIIDCLKNSSLTVRLSNSWRWIVWNEVTKEWEVWQCKPGVLHSVVILSTESEDKAVAKLIEE